jgi:aryl-phospho-beta-D-glucosidase BglC (GH1 family)
MRKFFPVLLFVVSLACCCGKSGSDEPTPVTPTGPTSISVSPTSIEAEQGAKSYSLTITAPTRPTLTLPAWITKTDGTYKDYKITVTLNVAENDSYEERNADVVVKSTGVADVTVKVKQACKTVIPDPALPANTAVARMKELGLGWNMGNQLDAINNGVSSETCWGNPACTQATFNGVKAAGFTSVRIPVTWMGHIGEAPEYKIEDAWMNRVYEVVGYAEKAGLNVILNTHHDEDHGDAHWLNLANAVNSAEANTQLKEEIAAVWKQIAIKFKDKGDFLMMESFNELIFGTEWSLGSNPEKKTGIINEWNQVFVDAVRSTGGNNSTRWLGVPGYAASAQYLSYVTVPQDPAKKTMLAFHCYDPYDYTIGDKQLANWGHTGNAYPKGEEEIKTLFNSIYTNYVAKDIPIYMGEFGCSFRNKTDNKAWSYFLYYLEYVVKCAKVFGIPAFVWDNGNQGYGKETHCYIHHGTGEYMVNGKEPVAAMVKAWNTTDATYTLQTVYDSAPKF